jgi:hypothetical protein
MRTIRTLDTEVLFHTNFLCSLYLLESERLVQHITKLKRVWIDERYLEILVNVKLLKNFISSIQTYRRRLINTANVISGPKMMN